MATNHRYDYLLVVGIAVVVGTILLICVALFMLVMN